MEWERVIKVITLGPATRDLSLSMLKAKRVDFVRNNMSHSSIEDLLELMRLAREADIPFILDTEGSQIRTGRLEGGSAHFDEGQRVQLLSELVPGSPSRISLTPGFVIEQLEIGDVIHIDFDSLILLIMDVSSAADGHVTARALSSGIVGSNKAVYVDRVSGRPIALPTLTPKDHRAIGLALEGGVRTIAASFIRSGDAVDQVREATQGAMSVISKIECVEALENVDAIIEKSDALLLDRGDLSKEIPIEKIPYAQKFLIDRARKRGKKFIVATNLLETMIENRRPTRAEVNDVINTIHDGAAGLTLAAETAIGRHPIQCINVLNRLIKQAESVGLGAVREIRSDALMQSLETKRYLHDSESFSTLTLPHGGALVHRVRRADLSEDEQRGMPGVRLDARGLLNLRHIATGAYSPLVGFMGEEDLASVLDEMRLANGTIWPAPVVLDVPEAVADPLEIGQRIKLLGEAGRVVGVLDLEEKFEIKPDEVARRLSGTNDSRPGEAGGVVEMHRAGLAGAVEWIPHRERDPLTAYDLNPRQVRRLFEERSWTSVAAFQSYNVPNLAHEHLQRRALEQSECDGLFMHPVVGEKRRGDFEDRAIIACYEHLVGEWDPANQVVFATFRGLPRLSGLRGLLLAALCRKNFGCSHFATGVDARGDAVRPGAGVLEQLREHFSDLGIEVIGFGPIGYSTRGTVYRESDGPTADTADWEPIHSARVRSLVQDGVAPPGWMVRPSVSAILLDERGRGRAAFAECDSAGGAEHE